MKFGGIVLRVKSHWLMSHILI